MGLLDWIAESAKAQYAKGEPYRQAVGGLLQGDATKLGLLAQDFNRRAQTPKGALDIALNFAPLGTIAKPYFSESMLEGYGNVISSPYGKISILSNSPYSPKTHSITSFFVDEAQRNKGYGKELIDEALKKYPTDIGAQVSSLPSAKAFYNKGFRLASNPKATIEDIAKEIEYNSSAYMVK